MGLSNWQKLTLVGIVLGFLAVVAIGLAWVVQSLDDANQAALGRWLGGHSTSIWAFLVGAVPSALTYVFGKRVGKRQTVDAGATVVAGAADGTEAAARLQALRP